MLNNKGGKMINSVIIGEHVQNCWTATMEVNGVVPPPWNVWELKRVTCNEKGEVLTKEQIEEQGRGFLWYELSCANNECGCKKRVNASAIATL